MENIKKYLAVAGLSSALTASIMASTQSSFMVGEKGIVSGLESEVIEQEEPEQTIVAIQREKGTQDILNEYNGILGKISKGDRFTEEDIISISDISNTIKIKTDNEDRPYIQAYLHYKFYKLNNDRLVLLNPTLQEPVIDILTGDEIKIYDNTDLVPICDVRYFLEDFKIPVVGYEFTKLKVTDSNTDPAEIVTNPLKKQTVMEIGALEKVYNYSDILDRYETIKNMDLTDQTLTKYNSSLSKYNEVITKTDLELLAADFSEFLQNDICLTKEEKTSIYPKDCINLIYSESGSSIVIARIDEINGQNVESNFEDIFNSIDIEPKGYVVDRGLYTLSDNIKDMIKEKYGEGMLDTMERYGIPLITYDTNEICEKYNQYKKANKLVLK